MKKTITRIAILCLAFLGSSLYAQLTPELLYYKFDGTGTTVPNLASAPPVGTTNATVMGGLSQSGTNNGQCGGALVGSGNSASTDYLNTNWATNLNNTSSWTISFWTSNVTGTSTLYYIFGDAGANSFRCFTNGVAGPNNWILRGTGFTDTYVNGGAQTTPTLTTFVYDATTGTCYGYLNGVQVTSVVQGAFTFSGTGPFKVMGYSSNVGMSAGGLLDEFRLYSRALTSTEVMQLYTLNTYSTFSAIGCGNSYTAPSGAVFTTAGTYNDTIPNTICGDSVMTINLTFAQPSSSSITASSCSSYTAPSGAIFTSSGIVTDVIPNMAGCDSTITIDLTILQPSTSSITTTSCGGSYTAPSGAVYTSSGIYTDVIPNTAGCDSTITIDLTLANPSSSSFSVSNCDMYTAPSGAMYMTSGVYNDTIPNVAGCDSVMTITVTITYSTTASVTANACDTYTAPSGAVYTTSGIYTDVIPNMAGCDSTITIDLTVGNSSSSAISQTACDSYTAPSGAIYTTSGTYTDIIPNMAGCDSTITISLTVNMSSSSSITASSCGDYTAPSGAIYTTSGTYTDIIPNAAGCDSVITIVLSVTPMNLNVTQNGATLTSAATGVNYQWIDCSTGGIVVGATSQSFTATANGNYGVIITNGNCSDTSACFAVTGIGIAENAFANSISLYPNPSHGQFTIDLGANYDNVLVTITDVMGRVVYSQLADHTNLIPVELNGAAGLYAITIISGEQKAVLTIVKE